MISSQTRYLHPAFKFQEENCVINKIYKIHSDINDGPTVILCTKKVQLRQNCNIIYLMACTLMAKTEIHIINLE